MRWLPSANLLTGPHPSLPWPLDAAAERWARLRPRVRVLLVLGTMLALLVATQLRIQAADDRWGGEPVRVLVATRDLRVGAPPTDVERVARPPAAVPPTAVTSEPPADTTLAFALPQGGVLTETHLDPRGPAAGLEAPLRAVPIPVEEGWAVTAGGWVDAWVLGVGDEPATLVASSRPVLELRDGEVALVALDREEEVGPVTTGLALGRVLLTHAPPPEG